MAEGDQTKDDTAQDVLSDVLGSWESPGHRTTREMPVLPHTVRTVKRSAVAQRPESELNIRRSLDGMDDQRPGLRPWTPGEIVYKGIVWIK